MDYFHLFIILLLFTPAEQTHQILDRMKKIKINGEVSSNWLKMENGKPKG